MCVKMEGHDMIKGKISFQAHLRFSLISSIFTNLKGRLTFFVSVIYLREGLLKMYRASSESTSPPNVALIISKSSVLLRLNTNSEMLSFVAATLAIFQTIRITS